MALWVNCPHSHGMVPVSDRDILHTFRYLKQRPQLYRCENWPYLFFKCAVCSTLSHEIAYDPITWEAALEWAQGTE